MLQNTISITDCQDTVNALQWFKDNLNSSALLLTHTVFYGWALLTLNSNRVMNYGFGDPVNAAMTALKKGIHKYTLYGGLTDKDGMLTNFAPVISRSLQ